jgi:hypothetical protein
MAWVWPAFNFSDEPAVGVVLSVPLDPDSHVLNGAPAFDYSRSWSTSSAIHLRKNAASYTVSVDVYNLGLTAGLVFVDLVLWYVLADGTRLSVTTRHAGNLPILGARPGGVAPMITTPESPIIIPVGQRLTHVYAVAYDPFFDKPDRWASALMSASVPDFKSNAARQSRQVGCLNVFYAENKYAFELEWIFKGDTEHSNPMIYNRTNAPPDVCVTKATDVVDRIAVVRGMEPIYYVELIADVRAAFGRIVSSVEEDDFPSLLCQHPRCDPTCVMPDDVEGRYPYFFPGKGVEIDGQHDGQGLIIDIPDVSVETPWSPGSKQIVSLRMLLR